MLMFLLLDCYVVTVVGGAVDGTVVGWAVEGDGNVVGGAVDGTVVGSVVEAFGSTSLIEEHVVQT